MKRNEFLKKIGIFSVTAAVPVTIIAATQPTISPIWNELEDLKSLLRANNGKYYYYHNCNWKPGEQWIQDNSKGFWSAVAFVGEEMHLCMGDNCEPIITPRLEMSFMYNNKDMKSIFYRIYDLVKMTQKLGIKP